MAIRAETAPRVVTITRVLDAPLALVFAAWVDQRHLARWWGPKCFTVSACSFDARPGGAVSIDMEGPDGCIHPVRGHVEEIESPELLIVRTALIDDAGRKLIDTRNTIIFAEEGRGTRLTLEARVLGSVPEAAASLAGMEAGWSESLECLEAHLAEAAS